MTKLIKYNIESTGGCRNESNYEIVESKYGKYVETKDLIELLQEFKLISTFNKEDANKLILDLLDELTK
jgi:hypothetical protein